MTRPPQSRLPRRPLAIVFDMDGVLFDTETLYRTALFAAAQEDGHAMTDELYLQMIGSPWPTNRALFLSHFGEDFPADALREAAHRKLHAAMGLGPFLKPGVLELLDALDAWGLPRAISTSSAHAAVASNLDAHALSHRFPHIIAHGDYAAGKPAPDPFLAAAARLKVAPQYCVAIEDSHHGVRSAAAAGMMTIMVPDLLCATPEIQSLCSCVANDLHSVRAIIRATLEDTPART